MAMTQLGSPAGTEHSRGESAPTLPERSPRDGLRASFFSFYLARSQQEAVMRGS
jgi:hypothetical protein